MTQTNISPIKPGADWQPVKDYSDITYHKAEGIARIAFNRPEVRNAFRPQTIDQMIDAFRDAWMDTAIGTVLLTGNGPSPKDGVWAFCAGGDQRVRGKGGYEGGYELPRLHVLELQRIIRFMPKAVIAVVPGWAVGGGHSLHVVCDLTLASKEHARFQQADARVASFDAGYGSAYLAQMIGQKRARELFFLEKVYSAEEAVQMGMANAAIPHAELEVEAVNWARIINSKSPTSIRMLKYAFNLIDDGLVGQQIFAGEATRLAYMTDEAQEGRDAFLEKRPPRFDEFPRWP
ncbi:MAG: 1,4-dihydroxy-2-naphthoyl-CoA synthase [Anaerolineales bacterium]